MNSRIHKQTLALAGMFQAGYLVDQIAHSGLADTAPTESTLYSIFQLDPDSTEAVYNGISGVRNGLRILSEVLESSGNERHGRVIQYAINLLHLEGKLRQDQEMLAVIRARLEDLKSRTAALSPLDDQVINGLDEIYRDTLSTLSYRIQVTGEAVQLQNEQVSRRVRALLLAGVRSAMLWRQLGGTRWQLLFRRRRIHQACSDLLEA